MSKWYIISDEPATGIPAIDDHSTKCAFPKGGYREVEVLQLSSLAVSLNSFFDVGHGDEVIPKYGVEDVYTVTLWEMLADGTLQPSATLTNTDNRFEVVGGTIVPKQLY